MAQEKPGISVQEIFVFFTPECIDQCFEFLQKKIRKIHKVNTLLIEGNELANLHSESHVFNRELASIFPIIKKIKNNDTEKEQKAHSDVVVDLNMEKKLKQFSQNQKKNKTHKSCIIDKKAS